LPAPESPERTIKSGRGGRLTAANLSSFFGVILVLFGRYAGLAGLEAAGDGFWGQGSEHDMAAIGKDDGLGPAAAGHIYQFPVFPPVMDDAFGGGGVRRGYGNRPVHGQNIPEPDVDQLDTHHIPLMLIPGLPKAPKEKLR
jgi:hypothetical protein